MQSFTYWLKYIFPVYLVCICYSLSAQHQKALKHLQERGELVFTFTASSIEQVRELSSVVSFDHGQDPNNRLSIRAIANSVQFERFLQYGIPFSIEDAHNATKDVLMSNSLSYKSTMAKLVAPLAFPLTTYPTYQDYADQMALFAASNPEICQLINLGPTTEGDKNILFIKLSDNVSTNEQEPRLMYTSSMHGDEIAGYPMMLDLIDYLITAYNDALHADHTRVKDLLDNSEVWINPSANPDGTYYGDPSNTSVSNARRANANGWDLNRNFPDNVGGSHPDGNPNYEIETQYFMDLADSYHFVISANFHGGTEVINYPWDNTYTRHPDNDWYFLISKEYALNCQSDGVPGYMDASYTNSQWPGVTNGADWYRVEGGRQDFMNYYHHCKETTIELSNAKTPPASALDELWFYNKEALMDYLVQGTYGFRGVVRDASNNSPIEAKITLVGHDNTNSHTVSELQYGDFYRPVKAGTYNILIEADCYQSVTLMGQNITDYQTVTLPDVALSPIAESVPGNIATSNISGDSADVSWDSISNASYEYRYRSVGAISWTIVSTANNAILLSALTQNTQYEIQVRSSCNASKSAYSNSVSFYTLQSDVLHQGYFESGWNGWTSGGANAILYTGGTYSYENSNSIQLQDNSGLASSMTSEMFNLTAYETVQLSFYYYPLGMTNGKSFNLQYYDGMNWTTLATWTSGTDFSNGSFYNKTISINNSSYTFGSNAQFRFQNFGTNANQKVYIDQIIITGYKQPALKNSDLHLQSIAIIPNPFKDSIKINISNNSDDNFVVQLFDLNGRVIFKEKMKSENGSILLSNNLGSLQSGTYFLKLSEVSKNQFITRKLIKN